MEGGSKLQLMRVSIKHMQILLQLGYSIKGSNCALFLDNAQLPYLEAYNALFVL